MRSAAQLALVDLARKALGLAEDDYRALLRRVGGVDSSKDLTAAGFDAVMREMERLGFVSAARGRAPEFGDRPGMASPAQVRMIRGLWRDYAGRSDARALDKWVARTFYVSSLRFLTAEGAQAAITGLMVMAGRRDAAPDARAGR